MSAQNPVTTFEDPFDSMYQAQATPKEFTNIDSFWGKIGQGLGFVDRNEYDRWLTEQDRAYERAATNSARAWDLFMDSTKYQRLFNDIKATGYNPLLALQGGLSASSAGQTAAQGSSARQITSSGKKASNIGGVAMLLMAVAKLLAL